MLPVYVPDPASVSVNTPAASFNGLNTVAVTDDTGFCDVTCTVASKLICGAAHVVLTVSTERAVLTMTGAEYVGSMISVLSFSQEDRNTTLSRAKDTMIELVSFFRVTDLVR